MPRILRGDDVLNTPFTQTQLRRGYDEEEVDTLLADLAGTLAQNEAGGSAAGSATAAAAAVDGSAVPGSLAGSGAAGSARPVGIPYRGGILIENDSLGSKLLRKLRGDKG